MVLPAKTFHFSFSWGSANNVFFWGTFSQDSPCTYLGFPTPDGMTIASGTDFCGAGEGEYGTAYGAWSETPPIIDHGDVADLPPGETVDGHIYEQPQESLEKDRSDVETELETHPDEYRLAIPWYWHQFEPENYPDPTTTEEENHRCDLNKPTYQNPGGSTDPDRYALRAGSPFVATIKPSGAQGDADPYLRYGEANWRKRPPNQTSYIDDWGGWGWRHIQAKHGWGPQDEAATRLTLVAPADVEQQNPQSMRYEGPEDMRGGVVCQRVVVVEYGVHDGDPPTPRRASSRLTRRSFQMPTDPTPEDEPESYERESLRETRDQLTRITGHARTPQELRDVRLEGTYPRTRIVVTLCDRRYGKEDIRDYLIWQEPSFVGYQGVRADPMTVGMLVTTWALGG